MRAIVVRRFGDPDVLGLEEWPQPAAGPGEVVVRLRAVGVNPVEAYIRSGGYAILPTLPYVPGTDGAGTVEAVGEGVRRLKVGDRVYVHAPGGTYAQAVAVPEGRAWPLPETLTYEQGAAVGVPYLTAHRALFTVGGAKSGEWCLVHGASGAVGVAAVQMAVAAGMRVLATASTPAGRRQALADGAEAAFDHGEAEAIRAATDGRGVDLVLEMAAHRSLGMDLGLLAPGGRVVVVGSRAPVEIVPRALMQVEGSVRAVLLHRATPAEYEAAHRAVTAGLRGGVLRPAVDRVLPLARAPEAHAAVLADGKVGKIVLDPDADA
ncbi:MAG: NADPH:quinone reductase [Firmicutes bacterium]|nr:NADPH:quinone reductase [Bacillota bacterium]